MTKRLIAAFILLIGLAIVLMSWTANRIAGRTFQFFRSDHTEVHIEEMSLILSKFHAENGGWKGSQPVVVNYGNILGMEIILQNNNAEIVAASGVNISDIRTLDPKWVERSVPILHPVTEVSQGVLHLARSPLMREADSAFFSQLLSGSIQTALIVSLLAVLSTVVIVQSVSWPLRRMSSAAMKIRKGDYTVRVDAHERDEIGLLGGAFNQMAAEIEQLEQVRRDMVMNVSHDLRTPLTVVRGYLEALQSGKIADRRSAEEAFGKMSVEVQHLLSLIESLNEVAALDAGKIPLEMVSVNIKSWLLNASQRVQLFADQKQIEVEVLLEDEALVGYFDSPKMAQVIFNLLDNAVHYTPMQGHVSVRAYANEGRLFFEVSDDGEGVLVAERPFIFERFYRSGNSQHRQTDGYGMGLSIVRSIVNAHKGQIDVTSLGRNQGTTFKITLPLFS